MKTRVSKARSGKDVSFVCGSLLNLKKMKVGENVWKGEVGTVRV